jgi:dihydrofolate reductase
VGKVVANAIMSLDGYVAKQDNTIGPLFDWLQNGEIAIPTPAGDFTVHLTPPSAEYWRRWTSSLGALVCGRTLFEVAEGWQGRHTLDVPVVVVTHRVPADWAEAHRDAPFTFDAQASAASPRTARCRALATTHRAAGPSTASSKVRPERHTRGHNRHAKMATQGVRLLGQGVAVAVVGPGGQLTVSA